MGVTNYGIPIQNQQKFFYKRTFILVHLLEPYTNPNNFSEAKYSAMILVPKSDTAQVQAICQAIETAIADARVKHGAKSTGST